MNPCACLRHILCQDIIMAIAHAEAVFYSDITKLIQSKYDGDSDADYSLIVLLILL